MKRTILAVLALTTLLAVPMVFAQANSGARPRGARFYNTSAETTVQGTVDSVLSTTGRRGFNGTHLMLTAQGGPLEVHVGPQAYISGKNFTFAKGDTVEVTGCKTTINGKEVVLAREIKKGGAVLTLRDAQGFPLWSRAANR